MTTSHSRLFIALILCFAGACIRPDWQADHDPLDIPGLSKASGWMLIPMDRSQTNHLRAYGWVYQMLARGLTVEWLLNYRGGSFLVPHHEELAAEALFEHVTYASLDSVRVDTVRNEVAHQNMAVEGIYSHVSVEARTRSGRLARTL
jgi:hypothetical protein